MPTFTSNALTSRNSNTVNTGAKETLARLMATENLVVVHNAGAVTATFNTATRVLTLPVYNGAMTGEMYDMFVGHEVGHALYTPGDEKAMIAVLDSIDPKNHAGVHDYMNVVEDARIERLMKTRYPGLGRVFAAGYKQFIDSDFFGLKGCSTPVAQMAFIDRLNLHIKGGLYCGMQIPFSNDEQVLVNAVAGCKSFEDVVDVTREIYDFVTQPKQDQNQSNTATNPTAGKGNDQDGADSDADGEGDSNGNSQDGEQSSGSKTDSNGTPTMQDDAATDTMDKPTQGAGQDASLGQGQQRQPAPAPETQKAMQDKMQAIRDTTAVTPSYFRIPTLNLDNIIVDVKRVHADISKHRAGAPDSARYNGAKLLKQFNDNSREYINALVREFERKMAADEARRTFVSKSGTLDMSRIHTYMFNDDLFLKNSTVAEGKNHGMVMFIDWSGSMSATLENTMYQLMNLITFCNALRIPFEVYGFSTAMHPDLHEMVAQKHFGGTARTTQGDMYHLDALIRTAMCKEYKVNVVATAQEWKMYEVDIGDYLSLSQFSLINLCSSRLTKKEMREALENLMFVAKNHGSGYIPGYLNLGGTPLDEAVVAAMQIVPQFRAATKAQIVNTVFLTDGATGSYPFRQDKMSNSAGKNIVFVHSQSGQTYKMDENQESTSFLRNILRSETRSTVTGFFLTRGGYSLFDFFADSKKRKDAEQAFNDNKFCVVTDKRFGYDAYYLIDASVKSSTNKDVVQGVDAADTFNKTMERKKTTRAMLTQYASQIARDFVM
jgi:hypothetical protein